MSNKCVMKITKLFYQYFVSLSLALSYCSRYSPSLIAYLDLIQLFLYSFHSISSPSWMPVICCDASGANIHWHYFCIAILNRNYEKCIIMLTFWLLCVALVRCAIVLQMAILFCSTCVVINMKKKNVVEEMLKRVQFVLYAFIVAHGRK